MEIMNYKKCSLAAAVAATLGGVSIADAAPYTAVLTGVTYFTNAGTAAGNLTSSTATFDYDSVTQVLTQTSGTYNVRIDIVPAINLFRHLVTGAVVGNGGAASASSFVCQEGNFGVNSGASLCGNYNFGVNFFNDSTMSYGPGTAFARTMGGDDMVLGAQQSLALYNGFSQVSWLGNTLTLGNATLTSGLTWTLTTTPVPVPAAVWLFGSALGLMGWMRRKAAN